MPKSIILHMYTKSPLSRTIAWALNYKNISYETVSISMIEPRPLRRPLDGGYRKTPILQIDNHVYCDTKVILAELEKRYPEPSFYPKTRSGCPTTALTRIMAQWIEHALVLCVAQRVLLLDLPKAFIKDRTDLTGNNLDSSMARTFAIHSEIEIKAQFNIANDLLKEQNGGKEWILDTDFLSLADLHLATGVLFCNQIMGEEWIADNFPVLQSHMHKVVDAINDEKLKNMPAISAEEAIERARNFPDFVGTVDAGRTSLSVGTLISVTPKDMGRVPVIGTLVHMEKQEIVVKRKDEESNLEVFIHFPQVGFSIIPFTTKILKLKTRTTN
ncbi:hypothetical protein BDF14DRAFT_1820686 [Spinellus fusiger]|nr:hypothetical protein BDF14DRAFT_1820686 [Spinellus fusiger]